MLEGKRGECYEVNRVMQIRGAVGLVSSHCVQVLIPFHRDRSAAQTEVLIAQLSKVRSMMMPLVCFKQKRFATVVRSFQN
jgi:hypothetical protein